MKKNYFNLLFCLGFLTAAAQEKMGGMTVKNQQMNTIAAPATDCEISFSFLVNDTYPAGLTYDGTYLYTSSVNSDVIYKYNLVGQLVGIIPHPAALNMGGGDLAYDGTNLLVVAEEEQMLYKVRPSDGMLMGSFALPSTASHDDYGCAYENGEIWVSHYTNHTVQKFNADTGALIDTFSTPFYVLALEIINGELYGIEFTDDQATEPMNLVKFDKTSGAILSRIPWCIPYSLGLTFADGHFWGLSSAQGIGTKTIYEFESMLAADQFSNPQISIWPNPIIDKLQIKHTQNIEAIEIFNMLGNKVFSNPNLDQMETEINLSGLSSGVYTMNIKSNGKNQTTKIVKQ